MSGYRIDPELDFVDLARDFLRQRQRLDRRRIVGATVHNHFDRLPDIWPDARYVFLTRDPRDVARSCVDMGWAGTAWGGARFWIEAQQQWDALRARVPAERRHDLRFEDLVADAEGALRELCGFLGTRYEPAMQEIERDTTYRRPDPAESRSWRESATLREVRQVETRIGREALLRAGYQPSDQPPLADTRWTRRRIALEDAASRITFRARRYGWGLWLAGVVSRRLPIRPLRETVQLRIDHIDNQYLK